MSTGTTPAPFAAWVGYAAKALLAGGIAGVGALATGAAAGGITTAEYLTAAAAALTAIGAVYRVPNTTATGTGGRHGTR